MNPIQQGLMAGYSEDALLDFLTKAIPNLSPKINKAKGFGYSTSKLLDFLSKTFENEEYPAHFSQAQIQYAQREKANRMTKQLLKTGALGVSGGILAGRTIQNVAPKIASAIGNRGMPKIPGGQAAPPMAPGALGQAEGALPQAPMPSAGTMPVENKILSERSLKELSNALYKLDLTDKIEGLTARNVPEAIGALVQKQIPQDKKLELEKRFGKSFPKLVEDYSNYFLQKAEKSPLSQESLTQQMNQRGVKNEEAKDMAPMSNSKMVITPDGKVGDIVEERQGIASIKMPSGEIKRRKLSELVEEPPELAKQINDVISSLPEEEKSRVLAFASYNPGHPFSFEGKEMNIPFMGVQFHNGDFYMYPGVSKEQFDKVVSKATNAKTSGENEWGVWTKGDPSRGAGMHELIKELENEFGKNFIKFKASEGYDFWKRFRKELKAYFLKNKRGEF